MSGEHGCARCAEYAAEADRLRKIFDDAGQGEHNVLALIDHYQAEAAEAAEAIRMGLDVHPDGVLGRTYSNYGALAELRRLLAQPKKRGGK